MKINYRPEVDGLRTLAVFSVIFFHSKIIISDVELFKGGFFGVDVFFVISGYLIASLILKEIKNTNKFSFSNFYLRRARRILPALLLVIMVFLPLAWFYLLPNALVNYSKSILSAIFFGSNFFFYFSEQEYGAWSSLFEPFMHTWSLAVEEQFYIIFPLLVFFLFKYCKDKILLVFIFISLLSICSAYIFEDINKSIPFYFLPTRMWELLAGAILAQIELYKPRTSNINLFHQIFPTFGILLIFFSIMFFDDEMKNISILAIFPVIGSLLVIWFINKNEPIYKILSSKPFVGLGLISYSLYLWHYPVFAFARITEFVHGSLDNKFFLGILIILLSIISYRFIEKPFRDKKKISTKKFLFLILLIQIFLIAFNFFIVKENGLSKRLPNIIQTNLFDGKNRIFDFNKNMECSKKIENYCIYNEYGKKGKVFIVGDSTMGSLSVNNLKNRVVNNDYQFVTIINAQSWYLPDYNKKSFVNNKINFSYKEQNKIRKILSSNPNSIIIIGGLLQEYLSSMNFNNEEGAFFRGKSDYYEHFFNYDMTLEDGIVQSIDNLLQYNHKIILIYPIPEVGWITSDKIFKEFRKKQIKKYMNKLFGNNKSFDNSMIDITTSYDVYKKRTKKSFELLDRIENSNIYKIYPHKLFCNNQIKNRCAASYGQNIYYTDDSHLSYKGSEMVNDLILQKIKEIEK